LGEAAFFEWDLQLGFGGVEDPRRTRRRRVLKGMRIMDLLVKHPFELFQILAATILAIATLIDRKRMLNKGVFVGVLVICFLSILSALLNMRD